jgi:hypothetical protein
VLHARHRLILSAAVGDEFFEETPEYPVVDLFVRMKDIRQKHARAKELLKSKGFIKEVEDLGFLEAAKREPVIPMVFTIKS